MGDDLLYLSRAEVERACAELDAVEIVRHALRAHASGRTCLPPESYLEWSAPRGTARSIAMTGLVDGQPGVKLISANPGNVDAGFPRASGLTVLLDPNTARMRCVMDAAHISALRTASVTQLSIELLGRPGAERAAVLGAGELARAHMTMMLERLGDLRQLTLYDVRSERASALAEHLGPKASGRGVELRTARDAEEAVRSAELVITVTTTTTAYIPMEWLCPGTLLVLVSLDDALAEVLLRADGLYVDDWELVRADSHRLLGRMAASGEIAGPDDPTGAGGRRVDGTLGDLLLGRAPGRRTTDDVIVVNPFGLAIEDVAVAAAVHDIATREHLGMSIPR